LPVGHGSQPLLAVQQVKPQLPVIHVLNIDRIIYRDTSSDSRTLAKCNL
jgi:hypothetical protein